MGDVADDAYEAASEKYATLQRMRAAGCKPCPRCETGEIVETCTVCQDLGWLDKDGVPCEP